MALKLFNHRVNPSFGQHAIGGPTRVASAKAAANSAMGNAFANATASVAKYVSAQNAAEGDLLLQKEISESKKLLGETEGYFYDLKVYEPGDTNAPDGLDDYVTKWQEESGADPTKPVYIDQIFPGYIESQYDSVMNGSLSRLGKSNQSAYIKSMTPDMLESANSSNETSVKLQNARITSEATANIEEAMRLGKTQEALDLIKGYEDKHIFLPHVAEEFRSKATSDDTLGKSQYLSANQVLNSDDSVAIDALEASLWEPDSKSSKMTTEQKIKIQKSINDREKKRDDKAEAHAKKVTDDNSKRSLSTMVAVLAETKDALSFAEAMDATKGLEAIDQLAFIKINNAKKQRQEGISNERVMSRLNLAVLKLATPSDLVPMTTMRRAIIAEITQELDNDKINATDAMALIQKVNTMEALPYGSKEYQVAAENIYIALVGASKDSLGFEDLSPLNKLNANKMETALYKAMATGQQIDPIKWVQDNMPKYATESYKANLTQLRSNTLKTQHVIVENEIFNYDKSIQKLEKDIASGNLTRDESIDIQTDLENLQKQQGLIK